MLAGMLDHLTIAVTDYARSKAFYATALAPLGIRLVAEYGIYAGFGQESRPFFWIEAKTPEFWTSAHKAGASPIHVAFNAKDRATVDAFYVAGIAAGATDNGPPGPRALYHPHYYGAFVLDPDGNNIEAVCHSPV
jgi:catechol 2,3-dioxygenase-like lactoylglutathione lyase family enzyme